MSIQSGRLMQSGLRRISELHISREIKDKPQKPPVLILCPYPPFKASFFNDHGLGKSTGAEKYFPS